MGDLRTIAAQAMHKRHISGRIPDAVCIDCLISADAAIRVCIEWLAAEADFVGDHDDSFCNHPEHGWITAADWLRLQLPASDTEADGDE